MSLLAGAGSAAVASVIGGTLGLSGTVIGAAVGSIIAAIAATTIRSSVHRSRAAATAIANRRRGGAESVPAETVADENPEPVPTPATPWTGWARGAITVTAAFALGIAGILLLQLGIGRNLSPGTDQLQSAAAKVVVVAAPTAKSEHPSATVTTTVTTTATAMPSATSGHTDGSATLPVATQAPSASTTPSTTPTRSASATP